MSKPGDLGWLGEAVLWSLVHQQPLTCPPDHPQRGWLDWLGVPLENGPVPCLEEAFLGIEAPLCRDQGILPEVVYGCLVQRRWHPNQQGYVARTRSEILACFEAGQLEPAWPLTLEELQRVNAYRLQELTPEELLSASQPFWPHPVTDQGAMQAWVLLHLENFQSLHSVVDCLLPFFHPGPLERSEWRIPPGVEMAEAEQILGPAVVARLT
jgi:hypothetical protein